MSTSNLDSSKNSVEVRRTFDEFVSYALTFFVSHMTGYVRTRSSSIPLSLDSISILHGHHNLLTTHYSGLTIQERPHILRRRKAQSRLNHFFSALYPPQLSLFGGNWLIFKGHGMLFVTFQRTENRLCVMNRGDKGAFHD